MLIALKRLKMRTSNLAGVLPGIVKTWPLTTVSEQWAWPGSRDPVNVWVLNASSSKTAQAINFKFGRLVPRDNPDMTPNKCFQKWAWSGSCDPVNFGALNANTVSPKWLKMQTAYFVFLYCNYSNH